MSRLPWPLAALAFLLLAPALLGGCSGEAQNEGSAVLAKTEGCKGPDGGLVLLSNFMGGEFELGGEDMGAAQLRMTLIWPETPDSYWIYEERRLGPEMPVQQVVHHLTGKDGHYRITMHLLPEPAAFVGAGVEDFAGLRPDELLGLTGCVIDLERVEEFLYRGALPTGDCMPGAPAKDGAQLTLEVTSKALVYTQILADSDAVRMVFQKMGA